MWKTRVSTLALVPAVLAGIGVVTASAATLGGTDSEVLGSDRVEVASCDGDGVTLSYRTSYDPAHAEYAVTGVVLTNLDAACEAHSYMLTLASAEESLATAQGSVHVVGGSATLDVASFVSAAALSNVSLTLSN